MALQLRNNPYLQAALYGVRNRIRRGKRKLAWLALLVIASGTGLLWLAILHRARLEPWVADAPSYGLWIVLLSALHAGAQTVRRRRDLTQELTHSWLSATPHGQKALRIAIAFAATSASLIQLIAALLLLALLQAVFPDRSLFAAIAPLLVLGTASGFGLGWVRGRAQTRMRRPGSRYVPKSGQSAEPRLSGSLAALSRWPIAQVFSWATPDHLRLPLLAVLMAPSAGASIVTGLMVVAFWGLVMYKIALVRATLHVSHAAANWLQTTPMRFSQFAAAVGARSLLYQVIASSMFAGLLVAQGQAPADALLLVSRWLALVVLC